MNAPQTPQSGNGNPSRLSVEPVAASDEILRNSEARYRTLFENAPIGIVYADAESFYIDANATVCRMLGYTRDEFIGLHASDIVVPDEATHVESALSEISDRSYHSREWRFRRKDGSIFSADVIATKFPDGALLGMIRDITDRKRADSVREHLAAIVESSRDAIIGKDLNGVVTSWNKGAEAIFGYAADEFVGTSIARLIPSDRLNEESEILGKLRRGERVENLETVRQSKDGVLVDVSISASPIRDAGGRIVGAAKIARNITEHKAREREIDRMSRLYAALSQVNQAIVWSPTRDELFQRVCWGLVEHGGMNLAWIGWHDPETHQLVVVAQWGDDSGHLASIKVYADDRPEGNGPSGTAFRTGRTCIVNDALRDPMTTPWRAALTLRGVGALASFPIRKQAKVCAILCVHTREPNSFRDKEVALLEEAADDISFALDNFMREEARRIAEQTIRNEKLFSDTMIESMPGILYFYDAEGRFLRWNRNFEVVSGYSGEEISRMHPRDFFSGEDRAEVERRISEVMQKGESSVEADFLTKDGGKIAYFFTGRRIAFDQMTCLVGVGIDISKRKHAEESLAENERKYRELVENANSIILRWNSDGRITFLNEFGQRFFGYSAEEILGRHVIGAIVPAAETSGRDLQRLIEEISADPIAFEQNINENVRRNGERVWVAWTNRIVRDSQERVIEILSVGTDITERKQAEAALRLANIRFRTLFEQTPVGVFVVDPATTAIVECNDQAARQLGYTSQELCRLCIPDIKVIESREEAHRRLEQFLRTGREQFETRYRTKSGEIREVAVSAQVIDLAERTVIQCAFLDITERNRAELALRELNENLERKVAERTEALQAAMVRAEGADRIKSAFLASMSHELRTPLNSIIGFTGIILQGLAGPLNPEQSKQLDMVRTSARHLLALVNDVLDISKIEAGQLEVAHESFNLPQSIAKVVALVRPLAEKKGLALHARIAPELARAVSDERRFEQILLNLLSNAIKFTDRGEIALSAESVDHSPAAETQGQPAICVRVADTGMGIKPDDLTTLFQPFRQIDTGLARNHEGTGLGLAICRRLANLMGGEIRAESVWKQGSTFIVTLPLKGPMKS